jgi:hypothetical protein
MFEITTQGEKPFGRKLQASQNETLVISSQVLFQAAGK